ncbi:hypothetical protein ABNE69_01815, partial [Paenibacillus larvae]
AMNMAPFIFWNLAFYTIIRTQLSVLLNPHGYCFELLLRTSKRSQEIGKTLAAQGFKHFFRVKKHFA